MLPPSCNALLPSYRKLVSPDRVTLPSQIMTNAVSTKSYPSARKDPLQARQRSAACEAALVAALAGLAPMAKRSRGHGDGPDKVGGVRSMLYVIQVQRGYGLVHTFDSPNVILPSR